MTIGSSKARYSIDFFFLTIFWRQRNTWERIANFILKWLNKSSNILLLWRPLRNASVHCQNRCKEIIAFTPEPVASTAALWANVHVFLSWILKYKALQNILCHSLILLAPELWCFHENERNLKRCLNIACISNMKPCQLLSEAFIRLLK